MKKELIIELNEEFNNEINRFPINSKKIQNIIVEVLKTNKEEGFKMWRVLFSDENLEKIIKDDKILYDFTTDLINRCDYDLEYNIYYEVSYIPEISIPIFNYLKEDYAITISPFLFFSLFLKDIEYTNILFKNAFQSHSRTDMWYDVMYYVLDFTSYYWDDEKDVEYLTDDVIKLFDDWCKKCETEEEYKKLRIIVDEIIEIKNRK